MLRTRAGHSVWFPLAWRAMASFEVAPSQAAFAFRTLRFLGHNQISTRAEPDAES